MVEPEVMAPGSTAPINPDAGRERPWPTVAVLLLLVGQIAGAIVLLVWQIIDVQENLAGLASDENLLPHIFGELAVPAGLLVLIIAAVVAVLTILRRAESAWINAMFVQTVDLALGLAFYFDQRLFYGYLMMVYGVFVVVYLLIPGVQAAFLPPGGSDEHQTAV